MTLLLCEETLNRNSPNWGNIGIEAGWKSGLRGFLLIKTTITIKERIKRKSTKEIDCRMAIRLRGRFNTTILVSLVLLASQLIGVVKRGN